MKKTIPVLTATTLFVVLFATACGGAQPTQSPAQPAAQQPAELPAQPVDQAPVQQPAFAPVCQTTAPACAALDLKDTQPTDTYCVKKIPYQNIMVPPGTTFEATDPEGIFQCSDSGTMVNGKEVISCKGKELWTYDLKLTSPGCGASTLLTGTGQCQEGYGFDSAQQCCAPLTSDGGGSVTIKVNLGGCPLPQSVPNK